MDQFQNIANWLFGVIGILGVLVLLISPVLVAAKYFLGKKGKKMKLIWFSVILLVVGLTMILISYLGVFVVNYLVEGVFG